MKKRHSSRKICQIATLGLTMGLGVYANAQDFHVQDGEISISTFTGPPITVTMADNGVATDADDIALAPGQALPNFSFTLLNDGVAQGMYEFTVGITVDDNNSNRRIEAIIETVTLNVSALGVISLVNPTNQVLRVAARRAAGGMIYAKALSADLSSTVTVTAGAVTLDASALIALFADSSITEAIENMLSLPGHYTYRIAANQTNTSAVSFGNEGAASAFPRIRTTCANNTASQSASVFQFTDLTDGAFSAEFELAYAIQGQFNITGSDGDFLSSLTAFSEDCTVPATGGGGGGTTDPVVDVGEDAEELEGALDAIVIPTDGPVDDAVVEQVNNALESGGELADNIVDQLTSEGSTLSTSTALTSLETVNRSLDLAGNATQQGGAVDVTAAANTINNIASALSFVTTRELTPVEVTQITTLALNTLESATNLISPEATNAQILSIVAASSSILAQASAASGAVVSAAVIEQIQLLTEKAVTGVISNLPAAATAGVDLNNPVAVQALMKSNPSVLDVALSASAALPEGASITIGGAQFTVAQLIALSLGGAASSLSQLQGGGNVLAATSGFSVTTDSVSGNMTLSSATEKYVAAKPASRLVSAAVPDGISFLPDGKAVLIGSGVATELAPTAFDSAGFSSAVTAAGFQLTYRDNGTVSIALGANQRFSGAFGFDNLGSATSCGAISITSPTGSPASAGYAFVLNCANGPKQRITPITDNTLFYTTVAKAGLNASTDRNTGVITIATVGKFKPSFFVTPLTVADQTFFNTSKNAENVALRPRDANGDGRTDYDVITSTGVQVFYGTP